MEIKKGQFKVRKGTNWEKYHFETSADQVKFKKSNGEESELQAEMKTLLSDQDIGAALRIKSVSENGNNLSAGCLENGIYFYKANTADAPGGLAPGVMLTLGGAGTDRIYKIAINMFGSMYRMINNGDGSVFNSWKSV